MAFPKKFLWIPLGWNDLGEIEGKLASIGNDWDNPSIYMVKVHEFCQTTLHIGKDSKLFRFCPRCLIKTS